VKARGTWFVATALAVLLCGANAGCEPLMGDSKVAHGQLYQSDDQRYDPYFDSVHQQQVAAAGWLDEKKAARRPLIAALDLTPGATDETIVSATRSRAKKLGGGGGKLDVATAHVTPVGGAGDGPLFAAVEESARLELDRARKLRTTSDKLEDMAKHGDELKKTADHEYNGRGAEKADDKKTEKRNEIRRELGGSVGALRDLARDATQNTRDAQAFLEDLGAAIEAKDAPARRRGDRESKAVPPPSPTVEPAKVDEPKKEEPVKAAKAPKPEAKKPAAKPAEKPPEKPAAKPKPPPDEVFNP
jgi:hypothetical protein